jgi:hypothetical protein
MPASKLGKGRAETQLVDQRLDGPGKALLEDPDPVGGVVLAQRPRQLEEA